MMNNKQTIQAKSTQVESTQLNSSQVPFCQNKFELDEQPDHRPHDMMNNEQTTTHVKPTQVGAATCWKVFSDKDYLKKLSELKGLNAKQRRKWKGNFFDEKGVKTRIRFDGGRIKAYDAHSSKWCPLISISAYNRLHETNGQEGLCIQRICMKTGEVVLFEPDTPGYDEVFRSSVISEAKNAQEQSNDHTDPRKKGECKYHTWSKSELS